ncbi:hypothetical protein QQ056_11155 [Oscillatoria laete-virens NRMC-F 0139]|nr:hypothetical protein [Oscillatoria laete-virens]MDL5054098.1 hypothetical protein [Oscillatoria laete-virens NRMC-F 0139]
MDALLPKQYPVDCVVNKTISAGMGMLDDNSRTAVIDQLRSQISHLESDFVTRRHAVLGSTIPALDRLLPDRGVALGSFVELIQPIPGTQAFNVAFRVARNVLEQRTRWAVFDSAGMFNPAAVGRAGLRVDQLTLIRADVSQAGWAFAQLLRSKEIGASFCVLPSMDNMLFRRLQLAAEQGGGLGFVIRPASAQKKPCWGSLRLLVEPTALAAVRLTVLHARGNAAAAGNSFEVVP